MKTKAIIIDIDGTLLDDTRGRLMWSANPELHFDEIISSSLMDPPNKWCKDIVQSMSQAGSSVVFLTARDEEYRGITIQWIMNNIDSNVEWELLMRERGDKRPDSAVKMNIYYKHIFPHYDVSFAIDDKSSVVDMWRNLGIPALHCADNYR